MPNNVDGSTPLNFERNMIGEDELAQGRFALKNMKTGDRQTVGEAELAAIITR